jgi:hypothetical protein
MTTEYGVVHHLSSFDDLHRGPMTRQEAIEWVTEFEGDGGRPGAFLVVSRELTDWSLHTDRETGFSLA